MGLLSRGRVGVAQSAKKLACGLLFVSLAVAPMSAAARDIPLRTPRVTSADTISPLLVLVSLNKQRVHIYDVNGEIASSRVSTGMTGFNTPTGVFSLLEKNETHTSNIYHGASMPFMQRLTWSGIALHAGVVPGYRASHGCIRMPYNFARSLFGMTRIGTRVVVTHEETRPVPFDHPALFKPLPEDDRRPNIAAEPKVASNDKTGELLEINRFIGVTPALADAVAAMPESVPRPKSRAEADRMITDRIAKLQSALKSAERARMAATEKAKTAVRDADAARQKLEAGRRIVEPARAAVVEAERRQRDAIKAFEDFISGRPAAATANARSGRAAVVPVALADPEKREIELENAILDATQEVDLSRADVAEDEMDFAVVQAEFSAADAARKSAIEVVRQAQIVLRSAQTALITANKEIVRRMKPVSVFISFKTQRIYVRQGFDPVLEAPISIDTPPGRIGTHVFTAMRYADGDTGRFDWRLVSAHTPTASEMAGEWLVRAKDSRKQRQSAPQSTVSNIQAANLALDSISIPDNVLATITELARPGASLIVSDRDLPSNENGLGTEFVVLTR